MAASTPVSNQSSFFSHAQSLNQAEPQDLASDYSSEIDQLLALHDIVGARTRFQQAVNAGVWNPNASISIQRICQREGAAIEQRLMDAEAAAATQAQPDEEKR